MFLRQVYDDELAQAAYVVGCQQTGEALVIDPERDIDRYYKLAADNGLTIVAVAETHIHADFVSGSREFSRDPNVTLYLSALGGDDWSYSWPDNTTSVRYLRDGDKIMIGYVEIEAVHSPGHTPEHLSYKIIDRGGGADEAVAIATGDFLFVGDVGRPDLLESAAGVAGAMEPSARTLQSSLAGRISTLPDFVQVLPGHGAGSACGKSLGAIPSSTVGYERRFNGTLKLAETSTEGFVREILSGQPEPPLYFKRMKHVNRDGIRVTGGPPQAPKLNADEFVRQSKSVTAAVLDARPDRRAFAAEHLEGAICAPMDGSSFTNAAGSFLGVEDTILLILESERSLDEALRKLYRIGLDNVAGWVTFEELKAAGVPMTALATVQFQRFDPNRLPADSAVLDVRGSSEFGDGHVPNAVNAPYTRIAEQLDRLPADKQYYVYCASGRRAALTSSFLEAKGYKTVLIDGSGDEKFIPHVA